MNWSDCPPAVRSQVDALVASSRRLIGAHLRGIYLHGSLAMGGFSPARSDIDLLILMTTPPTADQKRRFTQAILDISDRPQPLELSVLNTKQFQPWQYPTPFDFHFGESHRAQIVSNLRSGSAPLWTDGERNDPDLAAHFAVTLARGITLFGESIEAVVPPVPAADFKDSLLEDLIWSRDLIEEIPVYTILNGCRMCAYFEQGLVLSKIEGADWALAHLPNHFCGIIERAQVSAQDDGTAAFDTSVVLAFADYTFERAGKTSQPK